MYKNNKPDTIGGMIYEKYPKILDAFKRKYHPEPIKSARNY